MVITKEELKKVIRQVLDEAVTAEEAQQISQMLSVVTNYVREEMNEDPDNVSIAAAAEDASEKASGIDL